MLACLASFFARTKIPAFLLSRSSDTTPTNLLFYGHIKDEALIICGRFPAELVFKRRDRFVVSFNRGKG